MWFYINFLNVKYISKIFFSSFVFIGKKLCIYYDVCDICIVKVFFEDGVEFGMLMVVVLWCYIFYFVCVCCEICCLVWLGKFKYREGDDLIEVWEKMKCGNVWKDKWVVIVLVKVYMENCELLFKCF